MNHQTWYAVLVYKDLWGDEQIDKYKMLGTHATKESAEEHISFLTPEFDGDKFEVMTAERFRWLTRTTNKAF